MLKLHMNTGSTLYIQGEDIEYLIEVDDELMRVGTRSGQKFSVYAKIEHVINTNDYEMKEIPNANDECKSLS